MKTSLLLIICFIALAMPCYSQDPPWQQFTTQSGLPSNMVYDIYRDKDGYLWFATDKGISKYDGMHFETFSTMHGLPDNEIFFFKQDYEQRLWISTFNGELCYYKNDSFHTAANTPFLKLPYPANDTKFITVHADSSITIDFLHQTNYFVNIKGNKLKTIDISSLAWRNEGKYSPLFDIAYTAKPAPGIYNVFVDDKKIRISENGDILKKETITNHQYSVSYTQDSIYFFDSSAIYNQHFQLLYRFPYENPDKIIRVYMKDGTPALGTTKGLLFNGELLLKGEKISSITQDLNGNLWVGTLGHGAFQSKNNYARYTTYKAAYQGLASYSYKTGQGILFATSVNKLYKIGSDKTKSLSLIDSFRLHEGAQYIDDNCFYVFDGNWLFKMTFAGKRRIHHKEVYDLKLNAFPKTLIVDDSIAYIHLQNTIAKVNYAKGERHYFARESESRIFCVSKDADNNIWYTTKNMYKLLGTGSVHQPQFDGISFKWFKFFGDNLIGVTHAGRLIITKTSRKNKLRYTVLQDDCKWGAAYKLDSVHILFSTDGLYRLMTLCPSVADTVQFSMSIVENEFIPESAEHVTSNDTNVFFFKQGVIYSLPIQELLLKPGRPHIADVRFRTKKGYYNTRNDIYLSRREAEGIQMHIKSLSFDSRNLFYKYSISNGTEDNWNTTQNAEINLVLPGYGQYQVKIKAVTQSGTESEMYVLNVTVLKPFYLEWWFFALCFIALSIIIVLTVRLRIKYLLHKRELEYKLKTKVLKSEYKALNALMNPHFIFNSLNSIQAFINKGNKELANLYLELFSRLIRQNMHNISREMVMLSEEIELIDNYLRLEKMRFNGRFEYSINVDPAIEETDILIPPLLIQPLAENAIKHGLLPRRLDDNKLWIRVLLHGHQLIIEVEDNGVGFAATTDTTGSQHKSYALNNIYSRIVQLNELYDNFISIHIKSEGPGLGTKITIQVDTSLTDGNSKDRY